MENAGELVNAADLNGERKRLMETIFQSVYVFFDGIPAWLNAIMAVISAASAVTALTPTPRDDQFLSKIYRVLELLALNVKLVKGVDKSGGGK